MEGRNYYKKYIIGRNFVKTTAYEHINTGRRRKAVQTTQPPQTMTVQELDTAYQYRQRAKREKLVHLADVNFEAGSSIFVTLTFKENLTDYDKAIRAFKGFTKQLRRKVEDLRYIATLEIQNRGAFHFHLLVNMGMQMGLDILLPCWHNGLVDIHPVSEVKGSMLYMTKDFTMQNRSHVLFNRRCYFLSQGLDSCIEVNTWNSAKGQLQNVQKMLAGRVANKSNSVNTTNAGQTEYRDYYFPTNLFPAVVTAKPRG